MVVFRDVLKRLTLATWVRKMYSLGASDNKDTHERLATKALIKNAYVVASVCATINKYY